MTELNGFVMGGSCYAFWSGGHHHPGTSLKDSDVTCKEFILSDISDLCLRCKCEPF